MPRLEKMMQNYELQIEREALKDVERKKQQAAAASSKFSDPNALIGGFQRGTGKVRKGDIEQEKFLKSMKGDSPQEMPQDLIDFLNEMGPLKKEVDKTFTSRRIVEQIQKDGVGEEAFFEKEARERRLKQRRDRLYSKNLLAATGDSAVQDSPSSYGSVSEAGEEKVAQKNILLTDDQIAELLRKRRSTDEKNSVQDADDIIQQILENIDIPVIMVDTDKGLVAAWKYNCLALQNLGLELYETFGSTTDSPENATLKVDGK